MTETPAPDTPATERPAPQHRRPASTDAATVDAVGKLTKALETTERARGALYAFHQLAGESDRYVEEAMHQLRDAGHPAWADRLERELFGRNVLEGRWTFQIVEEYDDGYWSLFRRLEAEVRDDLAEGRRHLREAGMKEDHRTHGEPGHAARPPEHTPA
ncbi:MAG TPA: hypothetical protein VFJ89_10825, partial [Nocardioides sp.]|jgi:hypothetical protein|nr:hypothetical protein [Nocardioides sp.]